MYLSAVERTRNIEFAEWGYKTTCKLNIPVAKACPIEATLSELTFLDK
jgi:hypothetical protein